MSTRYYICGQVGSGTEDDPYRPEIADVSGVRDWAANQECAAGPTPLPRFLVHVLGDAALHEALSVSPANPDGYDYLDIADDGSVTYASID